MNNNGVVTIGLDVGYGLTKAVADNGKSVCFESRVAPAEFIRFQADIGAPVQTNGLTLHDTEEGTLWVGELASTQGRPGAVRSPRDRDRVNDPITTCLADAAFAMLLPGIDTTRARVVTGLPVAFYRDALDLTQHLRGTHRMLLEGRSLTVEVEDVLVVPQPFGALLSLILDERGRMKTSTLDLVEGKVGVLDIGSYTTDMILVEGLQYIEARSGSIEVGVSTAIAMIRKVLQDDYRVSYEPHELEQAMRRGWLIVDGKKLPLNGLASERLDPIARSIEAEARTLWNISTLTGIVLAGGGSLALKPWLEPRFRQAIYTPNAAMANAVGFLRYGLRQWNGQ
ncbi:MAG: ParM/StbA family protein [Anaerolineae bacterium]|nr:ParM/StbA family protein [Anaerolineae bacterium]